MKNRDEEKLLENKQEIAPSVTQIKQLARANALYKKFKPHTNKATFKYWSLYYNQMLYLRKTYEEVYKNCPYTSNIPDCFNLTSSSLILGFWKTLELPLRLEYSDFSYENFTDYTESEINRPTIDETKEAIDCAKNYVRSRENSYKRTQTFLGHDMLIPRYYLMYFICSRLRNLIAFDIDQDTINDYRLLNIFINKVYTKRRLYFPKSSTKNNGFHKTLASLCNSVTQIQNIAITWHKRRPISDSLIKLSSLLNAYRRELVEGFLFNALNEVNTSIQKVTYKYLSANNTELVEKQIKNLLFYKVINKTFNLNDTLFYRYLVDLVIPIPSKLKTATKHHNPDKNTINLKSIVEAYKVLLVMVRKFKLRIELCEQITRCCIEFGEISFSTHDDFAATLMALTFGVRELLEKCFSTAEIIEHANTLALSEVSNLARSGYIENANKAQNTYRLLRSMKIKIYNLSHKIDTQLSNLVSNETPQFENKKNCAMILCEQMIKNDSYDEMTPYPSYIMQALEVKSDLLENNRQCIKKLVTQFPYVKTMSNYLTFSQTQLVKLNALLHAIEQGYLLLDRFIKLVGEINRTALQLNAWLAKKTKLGENKGCELLYDLIYLIDHCQIYEYKFHNFNSIKEGIDAFLSVENNNILSLHELLFNHFSSEVDYAQRLEIIGSIVIELRFSMRTKMIPIREKINEIEINLALNKHIEVKQHYKNILDKHNAIVKNTSFFRQNKNKQENLYDNVLVLMQELCFAELKERLTAFSKKIFEMTYTLHKGGTHITFSQKNKKVPYHISLMLTLYKRRVANVTTLCALQQLRNNMLEKIVGARDNPPSYFFGFFKPRDQKTQNLYNMLSDAYLSLKKGGS